MSTNDSPGRGDLITEVVGAFQQMRVPPGPSVDETVELVERAARDRAKVTTIPPARRRSMRALACVATAAAIGAALIVSLRPSGGGHLAFAEVIERVKQASAVSFKIAVTTPGGPPRFGEAVALSPNLSRIDWKAGDLAMTQIADHAKLEVTVLVPASKQYRVDKLPKLPKSFDLDVVKRLRQIDPKHVRRIEPEGPRNPNTEVFEIRDGDTTGKLCVDSKTKLPTRYEMQHAGAAGLSEIVFSDFDWDAKVDPSLFTIPPGYTEMARPGQVPPPAR